MSEWISVEDRLPMQIPANIPTMDWVLVSSIDPPHPITIARWDGKNWEFLCTNESWAYAAMYGDCTTPFDLEDITHWMPLPKPPEE